MYSLMPEMRITAATETPQSTPSHTRQCCGVYRAVQGDRRRHDHFGIDRLQAGTCTDAIAGSA